MDQLLIHPGKPRGEGREWGGKVPCHQIVDLLHDLRMLGMTRVPCSGHKIEWGPKSITGKHTTIELYCCAPDQQTLFVAVSLPPFPADAASALAELMTQLATF